MRHQRHRRRPRAEDHPGPAGAPGPARAREQRLQRRPPPSAPGGDRRPASAKTTADAHAAADPAKDIAELEAQAAELEVKARDLRGRIAELKRSQTSAPAETAPKLGPGAGPSG